MPRFRLSTALMGLPAVLALAVPAAAQAPSIGFVHPSGGQVGSSATVNINGGNLQGATAVLVSGQGVAATIKDASNAASLPIELSIDPKAPAGMREVRIATPRGVSNAGRIWIGSYPSAVETEPNNGVSAAQKVLSLPTTLNGQINGAEDADFFSFQAGAGDTYVFDLVAFRMASGLDGYLALYDARGKILQSTLEAFDRDPRIIYAFKNSGTYVIEVRDSMYRGGGNFTYQLTLGKVPAVTGYLPLGGKRGETVTVNLQGVNLGDMKSMPVQIPMEGDRVTVQPATPMGPSVNTITLVADNLAEAIETEPNDAAAQATAVPPGPVVLNGRIDRAGDIDVYRIKTTAAGNLAFDLMGRRIGSRMDSFLRVMDATGKELQSNDDTNGKDSRIVFGVQADTEYLAEVRNLDRGFGGDVYYRLKIDPPATAPNFSLVVTPDEINVGQGGSAAITVTVTRAGYGGPIALRVDGLPEGVTVSPAAIPTGQASAQFTVTAAPGSTPGAFSHVRVIGTATIADQQVERVAQPVETYQVFMAPQNQVSNRPTEIFAAAVMPPEAYSLDIEQKALTVKKGTQNVEIKVKATRLMGQTGQINITVAGQPANVAPVLANIAANTNEIVIKLNVAPNAPEVTQNLIISGNLSNNVQVAPALTLTITP